MTHRGFLHTNGRDICEGNGQKIFLKGWGLGNWLLPEGYMWMGGQSTFDRPRRIEKVIQDLAGVEYGQYFWKKFRENYITCRDIQYMKALGYNSVRVPINWRILMEEGPDICFKEDGFAYLDRLIDWCEEEEMYVILDLHGAPGGQTGSNIDDSEKDMPELFLNQEYWNQTLALWKEIAVRYRDRTIVGAYDLLNEPIRPAYGNMTNYDYLIPELMRFYQECIAVIRQVDSNHMLTLEGPHWATDVASFTQMYDDNAVLHFHRYGEPPEYQILERFIQKGEELNVPLWLGETGENCNEWYTALYPLCEALDIGYNLWTWKKMNCTNSPCSIRVPRDYHMILDYVKGGTAPSQEKAREIFDEYLENILLENCQLNEAVTNHAFRKAPFSMLAIDFDELPGKHGSYDNAGMVKEPVYRTATGMDIVELYPMTQRKTIFDCGMSRFALCLHEKQFVVYTVMGGAVVHLTLDAEGKSDGTLNVSVNDRPAEAVPFQRGLDRICVKLDLQGLEKAKIRLFADAGEVQIHWLKFVL